MVIPKLPFAKPSDPLSCERSLNDPQAWAHFVLPAAVLEIKQAAGRLIRTAEDEGVILLMDDRFRYRENLALFPREWADFRYTDSSSAGREIRTFWEERET